MKDLIDKYFTDNYENLVGISESRINRLNKRIEPSSVVSSAYIYVVSKLDTITEKEIKPLTIGFICMEISLFNTQTNIKEQVRGCDAGLTSEVLNQNDDLILLLDIEGFKMSLDRFDSILWEVYAERGIQTKRDIAEHFNIDPSSALIYINRLKEKFKYYVES